MKGIELKYSVMLMIVFAIAQNVFAQDVCMQLRSGVREIEQERARLCSEYVGTCTFLKTAEGQLDKCGDNCAADLAIAIAGCVFIIGWDNCNYVGNRFTDFQERRQKIKDLAAARGCLLF